MNNTSIKLSVFAAMLGLALPFSSVSAMADSTHAANGDVGQAGEADKVTRTIEVTMYDNYYEPEAISLKEGETVRFVIRNAGEFIHEFNIGTAEMHIAHQPEMQMMMEHGVLEADRINWDAAKSMQASMGHGMHDEPNSVLLEPGQETEIIWTFPDHAMLEFACNIPGHYDSGMMGEFRLSH